VAGLCGKKLQKSIIVVVVLVEKISIFEIIIDNSNYFLGLLV